MSTLKGTTMHPRCRHIRDLLECWFKLFSTSQIQFRTFFEKKNQIYWFSCCRPYSWRINYLCRTDIDEARAILFLGIQKLGVRTEFNFVNFELFLKKNHIFGFPWCSTREDLSVDVSITNVGLILTKLRWFQLFVKSQNSNFELFWKKKSNFWFFME